MQPSRGAHGRSDAEIPIREGKHPFRVFGKLGPAEREIPQEGKHLFRVFGKLGPAEREIPQLC